MNEFCIANIGLRQRRIRATLGIASALVAIVVAASPWSLGLAPFTRFLALPFVFGAAVGLLQHREKT